MWFTNNQHELELRIKDLEHELDLERKLRAQDAELIESRYQIRDQAFRNDDIEATHKAEARAQAAEGRAKAAEEYAKLSVEMAAKCASEFGTATGKALEQICAVLKELKPQAPTILPVAGGAIENNLIK